MDRLQRYNTWLWKQISPYLGQRVLEAGCGTGTFTRFLATRERVISLDIEHHYVAMVRAELADASHVSIEWADLAAGEWPDLRDEAIDTVLSMNVLEHLPDDAAVLERFFDILQPGGRVTLLVPAHGWLFGTIDEAVGHFRRYEASKLRKLLLHAGFELERLRYLNPTGVAGWFLNGKLLGRSLVPEMQANLYDRVYPALSLLERLNLPFGLSLLAIARKPGHG